MAAKTSAWWLCPNDPPCGHGAVLHDVEDHEDPSPTCCVEGCGCGRPAGVTKLAMPERRAGA